MKVARGNGIQNRDEMKGRPDRRTQRLWNMREMGEPWMAPRLLGEWSRPLLKRRSPRIPRMDRERSRVGLGGQRGGDAVYTRALPSQTQLDAEGCSSGGRCGTELQMWELSRAPGRDDVNRGTKARVDSVLSPRPGAGGHPRRGREGAAGTIRGSHVCRTSVS